MHLRSSPCQSACPTACQHCSRLQWGGHTSHTQGTAAQKARQEQVATCHDWTWSEGRTMMKNSAVRTLQVGASPDSPSCSTTHHIAPRPRKAECRLATAAQLLEMLSCTCKRHQRHASHRSWGSRRSQSGRLRTGQSVNTSPAPLRGSSACSSHSN